MKTVFMNTGQERLSCRVFFRNILEPFLIVFIYFARRFFVTNLYLHPKHLLYIGSKKQINRYKKYLHTLDTSKYCMQSAGFRGLCFMGIIVWVQAV